MEKLQVRSKGELLDKIAICQTLSVRSRRQAIKQINKISRADWVCSNFLTRSGSFTKTPLSQMFLWSSSPQGHNFWFDVEYSLYIYYL